MEPKIVELGPLCLAGTPYYGTPEGGAFGKTWDRFNVVSGQVAARTNPTVYIGLEVYGPEFFSGHVWTYMPCVQVPDLSEVPGALFGKTLPACTYAVFTAHGLSAIHDAFMYAYETWMPQSGYEVAQMYDFEWYEDGRFRHDDPQAEIDVYIPIKPKGA